MGLMTLAQFKSDAEGMAQRSIADDALKSRFVNAAIREFAYQLKFRELEEVTGFATVNAKYAYKITGAAPELNLNNFRAINEHGLWLSIPTDNVGRLIPETREQWLRRVGDTTDATAYDIPTHYHKYGAWVYMRPVPGVTVASGLIHYWKTVAALANPGDMTIFNEDWDEAVLLGTAYRILRHYGQHDRYLNLKNDFIAAVRSRAMEQDIEQFPEGGIMATDNAVDDESTLSRE